MAAEKLSSDFEDDALSRISDSISNLRDSLETKLEELHADMDCF